MAHLKELSEIERSRALFRTYPECRSPEAFKDIALYSTQFSLEF